MQHEQVAVQLAAVLPSVHEHRARGPDEAVGRANQQRCVCVARRRRAAERLQRRRVDRLRVEAHERIARDVECALGAASSEENDALALDARGVRVTLEQRTQLLHARAHTLLLSLRRLPRRIRAVARAPSHANRHLRDHRRVCLHLRLGRRGERMHATPPTGDAVRRHVQQMHAVVASRDAAAAHAAEHDHPKGAIAEVDGRERVVHARRRRHALLGDDGRRERVA